DCPENGARKPPTQSAGDSVEQLDDLDPSGQNREQRALFALAHSPFAHSETQICRCLREALEIARGQRRKHRNRPDVVDSQHVSRAPINHAQLWIRMPLRSAATIALCRSFQPDTVGVSYQMNHQQIMNLPEERALSAYRLRADGAFDSAELTRGPWDAGHQHAGPPIALAARALATAAEALGMRHVPRLTASVWRPIPIAPLGLETTTDYAGRNVAHLSARLKSGEREVARFTALAQREAEVQVPDGLAGHPPPQAPATPEASPGI